MMTVRNYLRLVTCGGLLGSVIAGCCGHHNDGVQLISALVGVLIAAVIF